jgi:hypothetical protein
MLEGIGLMGVLVEAFIISYSTITSIEFCILPFV